MLKLFYLVCFCTLFLFPLYAEGESEEEETIYEEVTEEEAIDASDESAKASSQNTHSDITALRAQVACLSNKVEHLEGQLKKKPSKPSVSQPGSVMPVVVPSGGETESTDPDVLDLMKEMGVTTMRQVEETLDARNPAEASAMAKARKHAGNLPQGKTQSQFDELHKLYAETIQATDGTSLKKKANVFKEACGKYIEQHQTDSSSRSALYYLGRVLLRENQLKEAQNAFARVYRGDEQGPHAADALLGMAEVLTKQGNKTAAIKFLEKIKKDFEPYSLTDDTRASFKTTAQQAGSTLTLEKHLKQNPKQTTTVVGQKEKVSKKSEPAAKTIKDSHAPTTKTQKPIRDLV